MKGCQLMLGAQRGAAGPACPSFAMRTTKGPRWCGVPAWQLIRL